MPARTCVAAPRRVYLARVKSSLGAMEPLATAVVGEGAAWSAPAVADVTLGVATTGASAQPALEANGAARAGVPAVVRGHAIGVEDVRTAGVSVSPAYAPHRGASNLSPANASFTGSNSVRIALRAPNALGLLIAAAIAARASGVHNVLFAIADPPELRVTAV